jgi:hypothetical protein
MVLWPSGTVCILRTQSTATEVSRACRCRCRCRPNRGQLRMHRNGIWGGRSRRRGGVRVCLAASAPRRRYTPSNEQTNQTKPKPTVETKRNETKRNETKRNETKRNETKRNETKRNRPARATGSEVSAWHAPRRRVRRAWIDRHRRRWNGATRQPGHLDARLVHSERGLVQLRLSRGVPPADGPRPCDVRGIPVELTPSVH